MSLFNKKADITIIFVYIVSMIVVVFVGFLVIKFIFNFSNLTKDSQIDTFHSELEASYAKIYSNYGDMFTEKMKIPTEATHICLITDTNECINDRLILLENTVNIVLLKNDNIYSTIDIGDFLLTSVVSSKCECREIPTSHRVSIVFENIKNKVYLEFLENFN